MAIASALIKMAAVLLATTVSGEIVDDIIHGVAAREQEMFAAPADDHSDGQVFDFIVVGAGAGGCAVAGRLAEVKEWSVLQLEAGGDETLAMDIPYFPGAASATFIDWGFTLAPQPNGGCPGGPESKCPYPRGKVMGGSTTTNFMLATRGNKRDYDQWAEMGAKGWDFDSVLPYFRKLENVDIPQLRNSPYRGTKGPMYQTAPYETDFTRLTLQTAAELGILQVDYNGGNQTGFTKTQLFIHNGARWSGNRGYLFPVANFSNYHVRKYSLVSKVLFEEGKAIGVEYSRAGKTQRAYARREVILSAGAINTPKILMLSGIGPRTHLDDLGIQVVEDLPVGDNFIDHNAFMGLLIVVDNATFHTQYEQIFSNASVYQDFFTNGKGSLTSIKGEETIGFIEIGEEAMGKSWPDLEILAFPKPIIFDKSASDGFGFDDEFYEEFVLPVKDKPVFQPMPFYLRPRSTGTVRLKSTDVGDQPIIDPKYYKYPQDVSAAVEGIKRVIEFFTSGPFADLGAKVYDTPIPKCKKYQFGSDEYWSCAVRWGSTPFYHVCCSARMGAEEDQSTVVTPDLKVKGVAGLRVVDASVMPHIISGHLCNPTYMIGEKAADMIKCDHGEVLRGDVNCESFG